jgi:hypothetical protein
MTTERSTPNKSMEATNWSARSERPLCRAVPMCVWVSNTRKPLFTGLVVCSSLDPPYHATAEGFFDSFDQFRWAMQPASLSFAEILFDRVANRSVRRRLLHSPSRII